MSDSSISLKKLAEKLRLEFSGNAKLQITHVCGLDSLQKGGLAYLTSPDGLASVPVPAGMSKHAEISMGEINSSQVALIVSTGVKNDKHNLIFSEDPLASHVEAANLLHPPTSGIPGLSGKKGVHSQSSWNFQTSSFWICCVVASDSAYHLVHADNSPILTHLKVGIFPPIVIIK